MVTIINQQDKLFDNLRNQNNLLLGFIIIFIGILFFSNDVSRRYLLAYYSLLCSFLFSMFMFYLSMNHLSNKTDKNKKIIRYSKLFILLSVGFLLASIVIFFYLSLWGPK